MDRKQRQIDLHEDIADNYLVRYGYGFSKIFQTFWNNKLISLCLNSAEASMLDFGSGNGILIPDLKHHRLG